MTGEGRDDFLGVRLDLLSRDEAVAHLLKQIASQEAAGRYVCLVNAHLVSEASPNDRLRVALQQSFLNLPDGLPLVWVARLLGREVTANVRGVDLMQALCEQGVPRSLRHVLYGSTPEVLARLRGKLCQRYPGIVLSECISPPFRDLSSQEQADMRRRIDEARPDVLWVGLGAPKQELWMQSQASMVSAKVTIAVGAAFDFLAGTKAQAPPWIQRRGLEWAFRLCQEPFRLAPRYAMGNTKFLWLAARSLLKRRTTDR